MLHKLTPFQRSLCTPCVWRDKQQEIIVKCDRAVCIYDKAKIKPIVKKRTDNNVRQ